MRDAVTKTKPEKLTAYDLVERLRAKYPSDAYAVLEQMANGTGTNCGSWIDVAVFSLWPSKGIWRAAYEIKVSRSDWLRELSDPTKNEWARKAFHYFWYVVDKGVAKEDEVPEGCGLMAVHGKGLNIVKHAQRKSDVTTTDTFVASMARSLVGNRTNAIERIKREAVENNADYATAKKYREAAQVLMNRKGCYAPYVSTMEAILKCLEECCEGGDERQLREDALHLESLAESMQCSIVNLLRVLAPLASDCLTARDAIGKHVVKRRGVTEKKSNEDLRKILKGNP